MVLKPLRWLARQYAEAWRGVGQLCMPGAEKLLARVSAARVSQR